MADQKLTQHPIDPWSLYAHFSSTSDTYGVSYKIIFVMNTIEDWARVWNNCHPDIVGDPTRHLVIDGRVVISWSLFIHDVKPEWEDPTNKHGNTVAHRLNNNAIVRELPCKIWEALVVECIRGAAHPDVVGIQFNQRYSKRQQLFCKFSVWLSEHSDVDGVCKWLYTVTNLDFSLTPRSQT